MSGGTLGELRYLDSSVTPSLYRNGRVLTRRDPDGSDAGTEGVTVAPRELPIESGRAGASGVACNLTSNGFELLQSPLADVALDFLDHRQVVSRYYEDCARLVAEHTGARVFAFDHNVRSAQGKKHRHRIKGGQQVQGPALMVHGDYTLTSAPQRLRDLTRPPGINDTLRGALSDDQALIAPALAEAALASGGRFAIINVWRNIAAEPVATYPLALCDGQSVHPEDLVVFEIHYQDRIGENYFARHAARHRWYYYPAMTRD
ncbi:MAG: CmcJ/NvfI family oxidoreductase, partial [Gammaproteobacteria bacterium]